MVIVMLGRPGAGKGTVSDNLKKIYNAYYISTGDVFRDIIKNNKKFAKEINDYISKGNLVPDELTTKILVEEVLPKDLSQNIILDGYPRTIKQAEDLDKVLTVDYAVNIDADIELIVNRLVNRRVCPKCKSIYNIKYGHSINNTGKCLKCGEDLIRRDDDNEEVIMKRLDSYEEKTKPVMSYYEKQNKLKNIKVLENMSPNDLTNEVIKEIGE